MALLPYTLLEPQGIPSPLVIDSPHSGRIYPADFAFVCPEPLLRFAEDAYVDELVAGAALSGGCVLAAEFPRTMIDLNRAENDIDPAVLDAPWPERLAPSSMTLQGFGLVRRICRNGIVLYTKPLSVSEVQRRITTYYRPYHVKLQTLIAERLKDFGVCYHLNAHSMPDRAENGGVRPDFILGDRDGTSCAASFTQLVQSALEEMGYKVALNEPYKGREIVERYGLKGQGAQSLQIEINRKLYLDEVTLEKNAGFDILCQNMTQLFATLTSTLNADDRLAAE